MADLAELLARVEKASGPDRDIDADIYEALGFEVKRRSETVDRGWRRTRSVAWRYKDGGYWVAMARLTWSIDDATAFVERKLPGAYSLRLTIDPSGNGADLTWWPNGLTGGRRIQAAAVSSDPPLAIITATLRALLSQETQDDHKL